MQDLQETCSDDQTLVIAVGSALSTKSKDLFAAGTDALGNTVLKDYGRGARIGAFAQITSAYLAAGGASTLKVELVQADDAALTVNLAVVIASAAIAKATLVPGYLFRLGDVPPGITQRYLGFRYTTATNDGTAGTIRSWLGPAQSIATPAGGIS